MLTKKKKKEISLGNSISLFVLPSTWNNIQSLYLLAQRLIYMQKVQPWHHNPGYKAGFDKRA